MNMQIIFKSGASLLVPVSKFDTRDAGPLSSELAELSWTAPIGWTSKLYYVNLDEVVAVVGHRDPVEESTEN